MEASAPSPRKKLKATARQWVPGKYCTKAGIAGLWCNIMQLSEADDVIKTMSEHYTPAGIVRIGTVFLENDAVDFIAPE